MIKIIVKEITSNSLGNLNIKGESDLCDNTGNKIGVVKIDLPNCKVENSEIVTMSSNEVETEMNREQRRKMKFGKLSTISRRLPGSDEEY